MDNLLRKNPMSRTEKVLHLHEIIDCGLPQSSIDRAGPRTMMKLAHFGELSKRWDWRSRFQEKKTRPVILL